MRSTEGLYNYLLFENGGVLTDEIEHLLKTAIEQGSADAMVVYAIHLKARGVPADCKAAQDLLRRSLIVGREQGRSAAWIENSRHMLNSTELTACADKG